jgi:DNA-binding NtrC family response regulator
MFVRKFNEQQGKKIRGLSPEALSVFRKYDWPGNIRELENVIEHAFIMETGNLISLGALPQSLLNKTGTVLPEYSDPYDHPVLGKIGMEHDLVGENSNQPLSSQSDPEPLKSSRGVYGFSARSDFADDNEMKGFQEVSDEVNDEAADEGEEGVEFLGQGNASMGLDFNAQKEAFEKEFIIKALKTFKGRINQTALHANIPKKTLLRKIEKYGINAKDFS